MANNGIRDLYQKSPQQMTDEELDRVINAKDRELFRVAQNVPEVGVLVSMTRLRTSIEREERAIKCLTIVLVVLTAILVYFGWVDYQRH